MATGQQVQWQEIQKILSEQPIQQVPFAQYVVNIGTVQGSVLNHAPPGQQAADRIRPQAAPPHVLPRQVPGFLDREQEQRLVGQALARDQIIDVNGPDGAGKTALISQTMHAQLAGTYPDGLVYLSGRHQVREDLLQDLFEYFYQTGDGHVKVTENDARRYLAGKRALIVVDDANHLEEGDADELAQVAPQAAMIVSGRQQQAWQGTGVSLGGLPRQEAVALFERHWGQPLADQRPTAEAICQVLGDMPLPIVKAARTAAGRRVPLSQVLSELQPRDREPQPVRQAFGLLGYHLSEGERRTLGALAAPGGGAVDAAAVAAISKVAPAKSGQYLERLQKLGLVHGEGGRHQLDEGLRPYVRQYATDAAMRARAADYYRQRAGRLRAQSRDPDEENVMAALGYYYRHRAWAQVLEIAHAAEPYLATAGRWGQWRRRLQEAWRAGRELGDQATEAWAQNQLGIIAISQDDRAGAERLFRAARQIWQALGDRTGAAIAAWNLQLLLGPPPPPPRHRPERPSKPGGGPSPLAIAAGAVALVVVVVAAILIFQNGGDGGYTPRPPITVEPPIITVEPPPITVEPPPITEVVPDLELGLAGGCGQTYEPGEALEIQMRATVDGVVDVSLRDPEGERFPLFAQDVAAGRWASQGWDVPERPGEWLVEGDLNGGQAQARCAFAVAAVEIPPPVIEDVWVEPVEEGFVCPGNEVLVYASILAEVPLTSVQLWTRPPDEPWQQIEMERLDDQTYRQFMVARLDPGTAYFVHAEDEAGGMAKSEEQIYAVDPCIE